MQISASMVKELRDRTGAGMMDCKKALSESNGDVEKAIEHLRKSGIAKAEKKSGRDAKDGAIFSYIHPGNKLGALVEVNCETDFVANTPDFQQFVQDMAMQVAATAPLSVTREGIAQELIEKEMAIFKEQAMKEGKPEHIAEKMVSGRIEKFYKENVLLEQEYVRDSDKNVETVLKEMIGKLGENITISRFSRFVLGEGN